MNESNPGRKILDKPLFHVCLQDAIRWWSAHVSSFLYSKWM